MPFYVVYCEQGRDAVPLKRGSPWKKLLQAPILHQWICENINHGGLPDNFIWVLSTHALCTSPFPGHAEVWQNARSWHANVTHTLYFNVTATFQAFLECVYALGVFLIPVIICTKQSINHSAYFPPSKMRGRGKIIKFPGTDFLAVTFCPTHFLFLGGWGKNIWFKSSGNLRKMQVSFHGFGCQSAVFQLDSAIKYYCNFCLLGYLKCHPKRMIIYSSKTIHIIRWTESSWSAV